jgi:hypothetical protein
LILNFRINSDGPIKLFQPFQLDFVKRSGPIANPQPSNEYFSLHDCFNFFLNHTLLSSKLQIYCSITNQMQSSSTSKLHLRIHCVAIPKRNLQISNFSSRFPTIFGFEPHGFMHSLGNHKP